MNRAERTQTRGQVQRGSLLTAHPRITYTYNPAGGAHWGSWGRDGGFWQASVLRDREAESQTGTKEGLVLFFHFCPSSESKLTFSLLSALAACLHNGCHTSHPRRQSHRPFTHVQTTVTAVRVRQDWFTCQVHFLPLSEHQVTAGTPSTSRVVVFTSCLRGDRGEEGRRGEEDDGERRREYYFHNFLNRLPTVWNLTVHHHHHHHPHPSCYNVLL